MKVKILNVEANLKKLVFDPCIIQICENYYKNFRESYNLY